MSPRNFRCENCKERRIQCIRNPGAEGCVLCIHQDKECTLIRKKYTRRSTTSSRKPKPKKTKPSKLLDIQPRSVALSTICPTSVRSKLEVGCLSKLVKLHLVQTGFNRILSFEPLTSGGFSTFPSNFPLVFENNDCDECSNSLGPYGAEWALVMFFQGVLATNRTEVSTQRLAALNQISSKLSLKVMDSRLLQDFSLNSISLKTICFSLVSPETKYPLLESMYQQFKSRKCDYLNGLHISEERGTKEKKMLDQLAKFIEENHYSARPFPVFKNPIILSDLETLQFLEFADVETATASISPFHLSSITDFQSIEKLNKFVYSSDISLLRLLTVSTHYFHNSFPALSSRAVFQTIINLLLSLAAQKAWRASQFIPLSPENDSSRSNLKDRNKISNRMTKLGRENFSVTYWELAGYFRFIFGTFRLFDQFYQHHRETSSSESPDSNIEIKFEKLESLLQSVVDEEIARLAHYVKDFMLNRGWDALLLKHILISLRWLPGSLYYLTVYLQSTSNELKRKRRMGHVYWLTKVIEKLRYEGMFDMEDFNEFYLKMLPQFSTDVDSFSSDGNFMPQFGSSLEFSQERIGILNELRWDI